MNQRSTASCSGAYTPGMLSCTKLRPVASLSRSGSSSWPCELPMTAASNLLLRALKGEYARCVPCPDQMIGEQSQLPPILAYSGFVGAWHLWEKLTGRMEAEQDEGPSP